MTDYSLLPAVEIETGPAPDASVIFLHGLGDDGHGWSDVVPALRLPSTMRVRFLFPHAPEIAVTINGGYEMPAWYDLFDADFNARADLAGVRASRVQFTADQYTVIFYLSVLLLPQLLLLAGLAVWWRRE